MNRTSALAYDLDRPMLISSELLGPVEVDEKELFDFPAGIFGFPDCRSFALLAAAQEGVYWLQSTDHSALSFLLVDPFRVFDGYLVDLAEGDREELRAEHSSNIAILAIVRLPDQAEESPTANLQGPLAINLDSRLAKQIVLPESEFGVRCPFAMPSD